MIDQHWARFQRNILASYQRAAARDYEYTQVNILIGDAEMAARCYQRAQFWNQRAKEQAALIATIAT